MYENAIQSSCNDALRCFVGSFRRLVRHKLALNLEEWCRDDGLLCHVLDETLAFETALRQDLGLAAADDSDSSAEATCIEIFAATPARLDCWLDIDLRVAMGRFKSMSQSKTAWHVCSWHSGAKPTSDETGSDHEVPELRPTFFAESFSSLFQAITNR